VAAMSSLAISIIAFMNVNLTTLHGVLNISFWDVRVLPLHLYLLRFQPA
jgi:hypothetical protein